MASWPGEEPGSPIWQLQLVAHPRTAAHTSNMPEGEEKEAIQFLNRPSGSQYENLF